MDNQFNGQTPGYDPQQMAGSTMPAFSGAFDDDSSLPTMSTDGQPAQQYVPPVYGQPAQQYMPPMYGQPAQQYVPPMYGQPAQQYKPPMYGQPVQQYVPPMYGQPVAQYAQPVYVQPVYQPPVLPKDVWDRKLFRKHCSRVGWMLMADMGLMFGVELIVIIIAAVVVGVMKAGSISATNDMTEFVTYLMSPIMFAGGLSAIVGNMLPSSLHLHKWNFKFSDPFKGEKLNPAFTLTALFTALGLNSAWCYAYYYLKGWFGNFVGYVPEDSQTLYTPYTMPLVGMICYLVWVCIIAPVTEEYMFRGAMLRTLSHYGSGFAIVASSIAFGLMHGNMGQTPMAFLIGLIMGYVAAKSGNIRQTIFIHMVNNIIASLPQILNYFMPEWYDSYANYVEYFDYATIAFAAVALVYFMIRRASGLRARKTRLASGLGTVTGAERAWLRLEVPDERRLPRLDSVKHKFCHFVTSGGMIFFILCCLLSIFAVSFLPYITKQPVPGMGF
jgi:Predicted metal-dependent membrane protease